MYGDEEADRNELFGASKERQAAATQPASSSGDDGYTAQERQMLQQAKQKNVETTRLAHEALKVVEQTTDTAAHTLAELHRQDAQLDKVEKDYDAIEEDIKESKRALSYMDRCCLLFCCACCCDFDADKNRDKTRKQRIAARSELVAAEKKHADLVAQDKANKAIARAPSSAQNTNGGADGGVAVPLSPEEAAAAAQRDQLLGAEQRLKQATNPSTHIGEGLEEQDRLEIQSEIKKQDDALDAIGDHLDRIMDMAQEMNQQLVQSDTKIDRIAVRNEVIDGDMKAMQRKMKGLK